MKPDGWPAGATEKMVGRCSYGCKHCEELLRRKYQLEKGHSTDGEHKAITEF